MLNMINTATESKPKVTLIQLKQDIADRISRYYGQELLEFLLHSPKAKKITLGIDSKGQLVFSRHAKSDLITNATLPNPHLTTNDSQKVKHFINKYVSKITKADLIDLYATGFINKNIFNRQLLRNYLFDNYLEVCAGNSQFVAPELKGMVSGSYLKAINQDLPLFASYMIDHFTEIQQKIAIDGKVINDLLLPFYPPESIHNDKPVQLFLKLLANESCKNDIYVPNLGRAIFTCPKLDTIILPVANIPDLLMGQYFKHEMNHNFKLILKIISKADLKRLVDGLLGLKVDSDDIKQFLQKRLNLDVRHNGYTKELNETRQTLQKYSDYKVCKSVLADLNTIFF